MGFIPCLSKNTGTGNAKYQRTNFPTINIGPDFQIGFLNVYCQGCASEVTLRKSDMRRSANPT